MPNMIWPNNDSGPLHKMLSLLLSGSSSRAWFISPFVTVTGLEGLSKAATMGQDVRLITRLNDEDALAGVLDLGAIAALIEAGGRVRFHDKSLHAKMWIFDDLALLGSANLTGQALSTNVELMMELILDPSSQQPVEVFRELWRSLKGHTRTPEDLKQLAKHHQVHGAKRRFDQNRESAGIKDYGGATQSSTISASSPTDKNAGKHSGGAWLKINGRSDDPISDDYDFRLQTMFDGGGQTVKSKGAGKGRPRVLPGDSVILSRLGIHNGKRDLCIYGRGVVDSEHRPGIDEPPQWARHFVSQDWWDNYMQRWPYIFWLREVQIINGLARSAPWMSDLNNPEVILKPTSWSQQSHIRLKVEQVDAFVAALDQAFLIKSAIPLPAPESIWWNYQIKNPQDHITRSRLEALADQSLLV